MEEKKRVKINIFDSSVVSLFNFSFVSWFTRRIRVFFSFKYKSEVFFEEKNQKKP